MGKYIYIYTCTSYFKGKSLYYIFNFYPFYEKFISFHLQNCTIIEGRPKYQFFKFLFYLNQDLPSNVRVFHHSSELQLYQQLHLLYGMQGFSQAETMTENFLQSHFRKGYLHPSAYAGLSYFRGVELSSGVA